VIWDLFAAGTDTSANTLSWFFGILSQYPEGNTLIKEKSSNSK
jgi:cytochrome P450